MADRARHAFGSSSSIESALQAGKIDAFDILFLDGDTDSPKIGWIDKNGNAVILKDEKADFTELEADVAELETELAKKANADEVDTKIGEVRTEVETMIDAKVEEKMDATIDAKIDEKIADIEAAYEIIEF